MVPPCSIISHSVKLSSLTRGKPPAPRQPEAGRGGVTGQMPALEGHSRFCWCGTFVLIEARFGLSPPLPGFPIYNRKTGLLTQSPCPYRDAPHGGCGPICVSAPGGLTLHSCGLAHSGWFGPDRPGLTALGHSSIRFLVVSVSQPSLPRATRGGRLLPPGKQWGAVHRRPPLPGVKSGSPSPQAATGEGRF